VNIGIALVTNPRVLFLDEPTSGLDSYTSNEVMTVVKGLTKTGITICATIHNPTPYCFNLFDRLMILLHGRVVYSGENGARPCSIRYRARRRPRPPGAALPCCGVAPDAPVRAQARRPCATLSSSRRWCPSASAAVLGALLPWSPPNRGCRVARGALTRGARRRPSGSWTSPRARTARASTPSTPTATTAAS